MALPANPPVRLAPRGRARRVLLWTALMALLVVAQSLLVVLSLSYESGRAQDEAERVATLASSEIKRELLRQARALQSLAFLASQPQRDASAAELLQQRQGLERVEWRSDDFLLLRAQDTPYAPALFVQMPRTALSAEAELACNAARIAGAPSFSRSYFVPLPGGLGSEVVDLCVPLSPTVGGGVLLGSFALTRVIEQMPSERLAAGYELTLVEADGTRLARTGPARGAGVFVSRQVLDLPGFSVLVRADSLPLVFKALGCDNLPRGAHVRVRVNGIDLLTLELHAALAQRLDDVPAAIGQPEEGDDTEEVSVGAPLALAIDLDEAAAPAEADALAATSVAPDAPT